MLQAANIEVVLHDEVFSRTTPDEIWIAKVGQRGWLAVTGDKAITHDPLALYHLSRSKLYLFILHGLNEATPDAKAQCIRKSYAKMISLAEGNAPPRLWRIGLDGHARSFDFQSTLARMRRRK
ncbi:MAG: hypothetical protein MUE94_01825 [Verrucomicrobia bacterium]|nr:hypothetical protein [Verrucomicrobiota bacterium]